MTNDGRKTAIRERMARTGEKYTTARRAVIQERERPVSMAQPVTSALDDDEAKLNRVPMRPITETEEAGDIW